MDNIDEYEELLSISNLIYIEESAFSKSLGLTIESMDAEDASLRFAMADHLAGSVRTGILHGGIIACVLDIAGSLAVFSNLANKPKRGKTLHERLSKIGRMSTIDLRIDYLRPGKGSHFISKGWILRTGSKVAVTRMELHNEEDKLVSAGTGTYMIG